MWVNGEPVTFFKPGTYNPEGHAETTHLTMGTMDGSNESGPNFAKILQSRELGSATTATVYFGSLKIGENRADVVAPWFEGSKIEDFPEQIIESPEGVTEVADPLGSGESVLALTVHNEDAIENPENKNPRAQLGTEYFLEKGSEFWIHTKFLFPAGFPKVTSWLGLVSVYGPPFAGSGPWHLEVKEDELSWERNETYKNDDPFHRPLERGKWTTLLVHERLDEANKGWVEMWIDGEQIRFFEPGTYNPTKHVETTRLMMSTMDSSNDGGPNNVRIEQYRALGQFEVGTVYFGPLRVGPTREDVDF
jgi:hypothetical protein